MSAIKEKYHDQIEQASRTYTGEELRRAEYWSQRNHAAEKLPTYDILQLTAMNMVQLTDIACSLGLTVGDAINKQTLMYAILDKQSEL